MYIHFVISTQWILDIDTSCTLIIMIDITNGLIPLIKPHIYLLPSFYLQTLYKYRPLVLWINDLPYSIWYHSQKFRNLSSFFSLLQVFFFPSLFIDFLFSSVSPTTTLLQWRMKIKTTLVTTRKNRGKSTNSYINRGLRSWSVHTVSTCANSYTNTWLIQISYINNHIMANKYFDHDSVSQMVKVA